MLHNDLAELERLAAAVGGFCQAEALPDEVAFHLNLVLEELVSNVVSYGYDDGGAPHAISVHLVREDSGVAVEVIDDGRPFDPLSVPEPDVEASLEDRPVGGLGVHFLRTMMRDLHYRREHGRNHLTFRKPL